MLRRLIDINSLETVERRIKHKRGGRTLSTSPFVAAPCSPVRGMAAQNRDGRRSAAG